MPFAGCRCPCPFWAAQTLGAPGGLDFISDGQTVVLKPNLLTFYQDAGETLASKVASGINTDWRVVKAVADLVRAKNPSGKISVMDGATLTTPTVFSLLGYTPENLGTSVDELVALEGAACNDTSTTLLEQEHAARPGRSAKWRGRSWASTRVFARGCEWASRRACAAQADDAVVVRSVDVAGCRAQRRS